MSDSNLQASLTIKAKVDGQNSINELNKNLQESNRTLEDTAKHADRAEKEFTDFSQMVQNIRVGKQGLNDIKTLFNTIENAGGTVDNLRLRYQKLAQEWDNLDPTQQSQRVRRLREHLSSLGNTMEDVVKNSHRLDTNLEKGTKTFSKTSKEINKTSKASQGLEKGLGGLNSLLATLGVTVGASELIQMADAFKNLEARVKLATGEGANFVTGFEGVQEIANATFSSVEDTGELFARITQAGQAMNLAQQDVLAITETINQAVKLSGGSAEAGQQAITQLIQGLQSGVLRGEEFNSVLEQSPRLARAMADGLGVSIGQLRKMANEGKLTSEVVIGAVQGQADAINKEFASLPVTVGNSLIQLKNNVMSFVGEIDKEINSSGGLASVIQGISGGIEDIDPTTMNALKEAFSQLGSVAKELWDSIELGAEVFQDWLNVAGGVSDTDEQVSFLTRTVQGLSIAFGAVADVLKGLQATANLAIGGITSALSKFYDGLAKIGLLPDELQEKYKQMSDDLEKMSDKSFQRLDKNINDYSSSTAKALDNASKSQQQILNETAEKSRLAYEKMANDGVSSAGKIEQAFVEYAQNAIIANNNVVDERLKAELAERNLQAVISETGKISIEQAQTATQANEKQLSSHQRLTQEIENTISKLTELLDKRETMLMSGDTQSNAYKDLQVQIEATKSKLEDLQNQNVEFGGMLKADLDKASEAFKKLGLDSSEFATGLNSKVKGALESYSQVAQLAGDNTEQLARAYNATKAKIGDTKQAQDLLNAELLKSVNGNQDLANAVKQQALAQQQAKEATIGQSQALQALGVDMDAINNKMSANGMKMVESLRAGIVAIKEQSTSAENLKTALSQALDVSLQSAQTKADFKEIQKVLKETGVVGKVTSEHMQQINTGIGSGEQAVKKLAEATKESTQAIADNSNASRDNANAKREQVSAIQEVEQADNQATQSHQSNASSMLDFIKSVRESLVGKLSVLEEMGATSEQVDSTFKKLMSNEFFDGQRWASIEHYIGDMQKLNDQIDNQVESFTNARNSAIEHTKALSGTQVTANAVADAQLALEKATDANVQGLIRMDSQTLSNLQNAIDSAKQKMDNFAKSSKQALDNLESELARLQGDDEKAREIEQTRKLAKIEADLAEARRQQNSEAIANLEKALQVQKQISAEKEKQAREREQKQHQSKPTTTSTPRSRPTATPQKINLPSPTTNITVADIINSMDARVVQLIKDIGADEILKKLNEDLKRSAIK